MKLLHCQNCGAHGWGDPNTSCANGHCGIGIVPIEEPTRQHPINGPVLYVPRRFWDIPTPLMLK